MREEYQGPDAKDVERILSNGHVNGHFRALARELDILEPKHPDDVYKSWLDSGGTLGRGGYDSARANLAASFVSGFVHAGFGADKLMTNTESHWVYKNKVRETAGSRSARGASLLVLWLQDHGMLSATASLGLLHMWDVDGGLVPIDK